ncbi:MAG: haloacid dehalogenase-like hydrolase [Candidatus Methanofastidiosa archaeon]|nr:haloacid dehalogenase-like hydrolase [Candidatus Methanofastidiosa archaeon]
MLVRQVLILQPDRYHGKGQRTEGVTATDRGVDTIFFDLDGTLTRATLNNTFTFIDAFFVTHHMYRRRALSWLCKGYCRIRHRDERSRRAACISWLFSGLSRQKLEDFASGTYLALVKAHENEAVAAALSRHRGAGSKTVLLTACTEIPARAIASSYGIDECIATTFRYDDDRVRGIGCDTYGEGKRVALEDAGYTAADLMHATYYVDPEPREDGVISSMGTVWAVDGKMCSLLQGGGSSG